MSGKKWGLRNLGRLKQKIYDDHLLGKTKVGIGEIPISWNEFNKLYFSSRPVVVECPCGFWERGDQLMAFYATLRQVFMGHKVGIYSTRYDMREAATDAYYESLCHMGKHRRVPPSDRLLRCVHTISKENVIPKQADDWILYVFGAYPTTAANVLKMMDESDGFRKWDDDKYRVKSSWEMGPRKKVVVLCGRYSDSDISSDIYPELKRKYGDRFVFIDYTPEKELVDNWFMENEGIVDPLFDIRIAESTIDKRKVFTYIATNHLYKLREYNKLFPDEVAKWLNPEELRELYL
jgi:hypothetical protein